VNPAPLRGRLRTTHTPAPAASSGAAPGSGGPLRPTWAGGGLNAVSPRHPKTVMKMPYSPRRTLRACLALTALACLFALPERAVADGCPAQPTAQRFLPWGDLGWYASLPDSGFESGTGWSLAGGAAVVSGNEPFFIGSPTDAHALSLPTGAAATSAPMCLTLGSPTLRLLVRNEGNPAARLTVTAVVTDALGVRTVTLGTLLGSTQWAPTPPVALLANAVSALVPSQVSFSFAPADALGRWTVDDVYVDPYGKG
jgi:hypothetical protein